MHNPHQFDDHPGRDSAGDVAPAKEVATLWRPNWRRGCRWLRHHWRALDRALLKSDKQAATRRGVSRDGDSVGFILLVFLVALLAWIFFFLHYVAGNAGH